MTFHVGQKIVCIRPSGPWRNNIDDGIAGPSLNEILTVRGFDFLGSLLLEEWKDIATPYRNGEERGYKSTNFRPIVSRKTDISIFTKMLTPKKVDA